MITAAHIRELLEARPFQPFRIFVSDGSRHDVPHPEFAWVFGSRIFVGVPSDEPGGVVKQLSLLHVSRIEPLRRDKSQPSDQKGNPQIFAYLNTTWLAGSSS